MARIRSIKPEFFKHYGLYMAEVETGLPLRLAFAGLWTVADRRGRFVWEPPRLKIECLPYDDMDFSRVLDALATRGFLVKYASHARVCGWIPTFEKHQIVNNRERDSELPDPMGDGVEILSVVADLTREARVDDACSEMTVHALAEGKGTGREQEGKGPSHPLPGVGGASEQPPKKPPKQRKPAYTPEFERFWKAYRAIPGPPQNGTKLKAYEAWKRHVRPALNELVLDEIMEALQAQQAYKAHCDRAGTFCPEFPYAEKWLGQRRWENKPELPIEGTGKKAELTEAQRRFIEEASKSDA